MILLFNRVFEGNLEFMLRKSIVDLCKVREEFLVRFLYFVLDKLILFFVRLFIILGIVGILMKVFLF